MYKIREVTNSNPKKIRWEVLKKNGNILLKKWVVVHSYRSPNKAKWKLNQIENE